MVRGDSTPPSDRDWADERVWPHRIAVGNAGTTFLLILAGGLVTNTGSGLAVPDWPTTFGHNMFLYPWSKMVGGIFYEHSHRLLGAAVGLLTLALAVLLWVVEPRRWLRWLGAGALAAVMIQGILDGLRVVLLRDGLAIVHGVIAQTFLALVASLALFTSRTWTRTSERALPADAGHVDTLCLLITGLLYVQIVFGALLTHLGARFDVHLGTAVLISVLDGLLSVQVLRYRASLPQLVRPTLLLGGLLVLQLSLGLGAYLVRFTGVPMLLGQFSTLAFPVAHRLNGGLLLVTSLTLTLLTYRRLGWRQLGHGSGWAPKGVPA